MLTESQMLDGDHVPRHAIVLGSRQCIRFIARGERAPVVSICTPHCDRIVLRKITSVQTCAGVSFFVFLFRFQNMMREHETVMYQVTEA